MKKRFQVGYSKIEIKKKKKCNLYFKSVYKLQETRATNLTGKLENDSLHSNGYYSYSLLIRRLLLSDSSPCFVCILSKACGGTLWNMVRLDPMARYRLFLSPSKLINYLRAEKILLTLCHWLLCSGRVLLDYSVQFN